MSRFWNAQSRIRLACVDDGQEKAAHPQARPDRRPRLAPRPPQGRAPPPPRGHHRARNPRRPLPAPRRRTLHPRRRPCPLHLRRLSRLPHGLQSRHRTPPPPAPQATPHAEVYISFGIIYYWKKEEVEPYVAAIERGRLRGEQQFGTTVLWIIDAVRNFGPEEATRVFRKAAEL